MTTLKLIPRDETKPKHLRREGIVPIGLVTRGEPTRKVQAHASHVYAALNAAGAAGVFQIDVKGDSKKLNVMVKQIDRNVLTRQILAMTLLEINLNEAINTDIPVVGTGVPEAVDNNQAVLMTPTTSITITGKPGDIPEQITVDVSGLEVGHHINAGDVDLPKGITLHSSPDATLFSVQILRAAVTEEATEESEEGAEAPAEAAAETEE